MTKLYQIILAIIAITVCPLVMNAAVPYTHEAKAFLGTWVSPQTYYDDEKQIKISKQGDYINLRMKFRPSGHLIKNMGVSDSHHYSQVRNLTLRYETLSWEEPIDELDICLYWSLYFKNGELILHRYGSAPEEETLVNFYYTMYPKDDF